MSRRPVIAVIFNPQYADAPFYQVISRLFELEFNVLTLDCRYANDEHLKVLVAENIKQIDGFLVPGGPNGYHPKFYGEDVSNTSSKVDEDSRLTHYELAMYKAARNKGVPILCICRGSKLPTIAQGGKVNQDITKINASQKVNHNIDPRTGNLAHTVTVKAGTHLHDILTTEKQLVYNEKKGECIQTKRPDTNDITMLVNSWHHTASAQLAGNLIVSAFAEDGVIEAMEEKDGHKNFWAIQFHPEYLVKDKNPEEYARQMKIFDAYRKACIYFHEHSDLVKGLATNFQTFFRQDKHNVTESGLNVAILEHIKALN